MEKKERKKGGEDLLSKKKKSSQEQVGKIHEVIKESTKYIRCITILQKSAVTSARAKN